MRFPFDWSQRDYRTHVDEVASTEERAITRETNPMSSRHRSRSGRAPCRCNQGKRPSWRRRSALERESGAACGHDARAPGGCPTRSPDLAQRRRATRTPRRFVAGPWRRSASASRGVAPRRGTRSCPTRTPVQAHREPPKTPARVGRSDVLARGPPPSCGGCDRTTGEPSSDPAAGVHSLQLARGLPAECLRRLSRSRPDAVGDRGDAPSGVAGRP
jgi:hypothetical protein